MTTAIAKQTAQVELIHLTHEEKKMLRHRLYTKPPEQDCLLAGLTLVSEKGLIWYRESADTHPIILQVYSFKSNRWKANYLNDESFFALCTFDGRLWRCKNFKEVALLQKALKKDLQLKYPDLKFER
jgi:hypothetical protein